MKILAIDTSTEACSAALTVGTDMRERFKITPREHSRLILPMVDSLLSEAGLNLSQLDAVAFGRGPGSFTGLRIAAGVTQGLAFGAGLPVVPVSTLAALAQGAYTDLGATRVLAALDARMSEIYWGIYEADNAGEMVLQGMECVCAPGVAPGVLPPATLVPPGTSQVPLPQGGDWHGVGSGWDEYGVLLQARCGSLLRTVTEGRQPHARDIALLARAALRRGLAVSAEQAMPVYLRNQVAWAKCE